MRTMHSPCRHCRRRKATRSRGLCQQCSTRPGIRALYPVARRLSRKGVPDAYGSAPLPSAPTRADPGTAAKVRVLEARAARREQLFHPDDVRVDPDGLPGEPGEPKVRRLLMDHALWRTGRW